MHGEVIVGLAGFFRGVQDPWVEAGGGEPFDASLDGPGFEFDWGSSTNVPLQIATANLPVDLYLAFVQIWGNISLG